MLRSGAASVVHFGRRRWRWIVAIAALPILALIAADHFLDEPIRRQVERRMNERLKGYHVRIPAADFHVWGFSLDLKDVLLTQDAHPDPPVARIRTLSASVQWRALLHATVVADFEFDRPVVYFDLAHFRSEQKDPTPFKEHGWQEALQAAYPFEINELRVVDGDLTYADRGPFKPLHLAQVSLVADNIRNVRSREHTYPSPIHLEAVVFDTGRIWLAGHADFMAEPRLGVKANVKLDAITLDYFKPIAERYNVTVRKGALSADATVEYASDGGTLAEVRELTASGLDADWVHTAQTEGNEAKVKQITKQAAKDVANEPTMLLRVDHARITKSTLGFVNAAAKPVYRVFFSDLEVDLTNLSNHFTEGTAVAGVRGRFMGSGPTMVNATFRPENKGPDFDVAVRIQDTDMRTMNDLLRAYGKFDVVSGLFSFFSELTVKQGRIEGYVKPLYRDLKAYDERQDEEKGLFRKLYEKLVGGVSRLLENKPRDEVATKAEISGTVQSPNTSTWEVVVNLVRNAFFRAILPGFDEELGRLGLRRRAG